MTVLDTLITDRVQDDVDAARELFRRGLDRMTSAEKEAMKSGLKGSYGPTDMNRVREAMEYVDGLAVAAKRDSVYVPVLIPHKVPADFGADGRVARWEQWSDRVWIDYDLPTPEQWAAHLENINRLWAAARRFAALVLPRYDPEGTGYIRPDAPLDGGKLFQVLDSVGLLELRVAFDGPGSVTASGTGWAVEQTETGWTARLDYTDCPFPDINGALGALAVSCGADFIVDGTFTLSATLRYDYDVTAGTTAVRWSPFLLWREARDEYAAWGGAKPLAWGQAARGEQL